MKKLLTVMLVALLAVVLAVTASAELYNPDYYGVLKVEEGAITVDGVVDAAYGEPLFYYEAYGPDATDEQIGDYTSGANWFFTKDTSENLDDVLALVQVEENYAKGYAVWTDTSLYFCVDTNILGYNYPAALPAGQMWKAFCVQFGIFDLKGNWNVDWGLGIDDTDTVKQISFGQNKGTGTPMIVNNADGATELNATVVRDGAHIVYEVQFEFAKMLSFIPTEGDSIGLDICIDFGEAIDNGDGTWNTVQKCLTFVNDGAPNGYHSRLSTNARPLYFVTDKADADAAYSNRANEGELAADDHSISLFGCNEAPANTNFTLDSENKTAGFGSLLLIVKNGEVNINRWAITAVDGTGYDTLEFDMYVSDLAIFDLDSGNQLEICSGGQADTEEKAWNMAAIKAQNKGDELVVGWNHIILPIPADSALNVANVNFLGFYFSPAPTLERDIAIQLDNFRLSDYQAVEKADAQEDAAKIDERIGKLDEVTADNYVSMKIKVQGARAAFDKLSDLAKTFVNADMLAKLETAEAAIVNFEENPVVDEPTVDEPTVDEPTVDEPTVDEPKEGGNATLIIIIVVAVVVIAGVVVLVVLKKKKA